MTDSLRPTRRPFGRLLPSASILHRLAIPGAAIVGFVALGFVSSILTLAASERATRSRIEASYGRVLPTAPLLRWVDPRPLDVDRWLDNAKFDYPRSLLPLRYWLFVPKYLYVPRNRRLLAVPEGQDHVAVAYLVGRPPLPFVNRIHYCWIFKMRDRQAYRGLGLSHGAMDIGVVTYLGFFGCHVRIDEHPSFGSVS